MDIIHHETFLPTKTPVLVPLMASTGTPASSSALYVHSTSNFCCGSMDSASILLIPNRWLSNTLNLLKIHRPENGIICIQYAFISRPKVYVFCNVMKSKAISDVETTVPICEIQKENIIGQRYFISCYKICIFINYSTFQSCKTMHQDFYSHC